MSEQDWRVGDLIDGDNGGGAAYEILSINGEYAWVRDAGRPYSKGTLYPVAHMEPYRTTAQRAEDEAVDEMMSAVDEHITPEEICRALYRAGYRDRA